MWHQIQLWRGAGQSTVLVHGFAEYARGL